MKALEINDRLTVCGKKYIVREVCSKSSERKVYKVRGEQEVTYIIKELLSASPTVRDHLCRDENGLAVLDTERCKKEGIDPQKLLDSVGGLGGEEQQSNTAVIYDETADNNSNYFFQTEMLAQTDAAAYFLVNTEAGDPLDRLRQRWVKELSGDALLLAVTKLMIETAKALEYMHSSKHVLHLDIKPQNIYALGNEHDRRIKLLDLGSALSLKLLKDDDNCRFCIESTEKYQSPLLMRISSLIMTDNDEEEEEIFGIESDSALLGKLIGELSVRDDIYSLAKVMSYMLTGKTDGEWRIVISGCNRYCLKLLNEILADASQGDTVSACGEWFEIGKYKSVAQMRKDLEDLRDALLGAGISKAVFFRKGEDAVRQIMTEKKAFVDGRYMIDDAMLPAVRSIKTDDESDQQLFPDLSAILLDSGKKNLFISSEGGTGKTYLLWRTALDYIRRCDVIPIYIQLNEITALENSLLYLIADKYTGYEYEDKIEKISAYLKDHPEQQFLILADGLNEIPAAKPQSRQNAINNLLFLSGLPNVSVVITSRRQEISFTDFEQYEPAPLEESVLKEKLPDYDGLSFELQQLLTTPFNLSLYLHLPKEYRDRTIETATDLMQVNVDWLREKLKRQGIPAGTTDCLFDLILPVLSYELSKKNKIDFVRVEFVKQAKNWASLIADEDDEDDDTEFESYLEICHDILSNDRITSKLACRNLLGYLIDNAVVYRTEDNKYRFYHQNHRDFFAVKGWVFIVSHYSYLKALELDNIEEYLSVGFHLFDYLRELIHTETVKNQKKATENHSLRKRDFYEALFDNSTRGIKHDETAQKFNRIIINTMKLLGIFKKGREETEEDYLHGKPSSFPSFFHHDFSELDLSTADFCGTVLDHCDFSGACLYSHPFGMEDFPEYPDLMWNDESKVIVLFCIGFIRAIHFNHAAIKDKLIEPFDACAVHADRVYVVRNHQPHKSERHKGLMQIGEAAVFKADTLEKIAEHELSIPKKVFDELISQGMFMGKDLSKTEIRDIILLPNGTLVSLTSETMLFFDGDHYEYQFYHHDKLYRFFTRTDTHTDLPFKQSIDRSHLEVFRSDPCREDIVLFDDAAFSRDIIDYQRLKGADPEKSRFIVVKINAKDTAQPVKCCGPFSSELFDGYGELLDIRSNADGLYANIKRDGEILSIEFDPETGTVGQAAESKKAVLIDRDSLSTEPLREHNGFEGERQQSRQIRLIKKDQDGLRFFDLHYQSEQRHEVFSICNDTFCLFTDFGLRVGRLDMRLQDEGFFLSNRSFPFYSFSSKLLYQFDQQTIALLSPNHYYYDFIAHRFNTDPIYHESPQRSKPPMVPRYLSRYLDGDGSGDNSKKEQKQRHCMKELPNAFLLYKGSWHPLDDSDFPKGSKQYVLREKLKTVLKGHRDTLFVSCMDIVYDRYLFACAVSDDAGIAAFTYRETIDTFLILDLELDRIVRIKNPCPYEHTESLDVRDDLLFADLGADKTAGRIDNVFLMSRNHLYELSFDLERKTAQIMYETEILPHVKLLDCNFTNVEISLNPETQNDGTDIAERKRNILRIWEENNIKDTSTV